jgi:hypothetical protein
MQTNPKTLRKLTIRYFAKKSSDGQPIMIGQIARRRQSARLR